MNTLETDRLALRNFGKDDDADLFAWANSISEKPMMPSSGWRSAGDNGPSASILAFREARKRRKWSIRTMRSSLWSICRLKPSSVAFRAR